MDSLTFKMNYTIGGVEKTVACFPIVPEMILAKDSSEYKNIITNNSVFIFKNILSENISDFDTIKEIEENSIFNKINILVYKNGNYKFKVYFHPVDCKFDNDRCVCEVTPTYDDIYNCLKNNWEKEYNILKYDGLTTIEPQKYIIDNPANLELFTCRKNYRVYIECYTGDPLMFSTGGNSFYALVDMLGNTGLSSDGLFVDVFGYTNPTDSYDGLQAYYYKEIYATINFYTDEFPYFNADVNTLQWILNKWRIYKNRFTVLENIGGNFYNVLVETTWCAETVFTAYDDDNLPQNPDVISYINFKDTNVAGINGNWWGREPFYNSWAAQELITPTTGNDIYHYFRNIYSCDLFEFNLKNPVGWTQADEQPITRGRELIATMNYLLEKTDCNIVVNSQFLYPYGNNPLYQEERNPMYILNKAYDIKHPLWNDNPATEMFISFKWLLEAVCLCLNCNWDIKEGILFNELIIEHLNYFENNLSYVYQQIPSYDLTQTTEIQTGQKEIINTNKYSYNLGELFNTESWQLSEFLDYDFAKLSIDYDVKFNKEIKRKEEIILLSTDVAGIISEPGKFSDDSVVLVACITPEGQTPRTITEEGYRTKRQVTNGWLCLSNLFNRFYRHGRVLKEGVLDTENNELLNPEIMLSVKDNKLQSIEVRDCGGTMFFDKKGINTFLGTGRVLSAEYNVRKDVTKFEILI